MADRGEKMDIQAYEDFLRIIDSIAGSEMSFQYEMETEKGYQIVKSAISEAKELGGFGERRIALENLLYFFMRLLFMISKTNPIIAKNIIHLTKLYSIITPLCYWN